MISTPQRPVPLEHYLYTKNEMHKVVDAARNFLAQGSASFHLRFRSLFSFRELGTKTREKLLNENRTRNAKQRGCLLFNELALVAVLLLSESSNVAVTLVVEGTNVAHLSLAEEDGAGVMPLEPYKAGLTGTYMSIYLVI